MIFAKLPDGLLESESVTITSTGPRQSEEELRAKGFLPYVAAERPSEALPRGKAWWPKYARDGEAVAQTWFQKEVAPPPRTISKMKIVAYLVQAGAWAQVKAWMEAAGVYDIFLAANVLEEGETYFSQGIAALKTELSWTDEQVEALLAACEAEGAT